MCEASHKRGAIANTSKYVTVRDTPAHLDHSTGSHVRSPNVHSPLSQMSTVETSRLPPALTRAKALGSPRVQVLGAPRCSLIPRDVVFLEHRDTTARGERNHAELEGKGGKDEDRDRQLDRAVEICASGC